MDNKINDSPNCPKIIFYCRSLIGADVSGVVDEEVVVELVVVLVLISGPFMPLPLPRLPFPLPLPLPWPLSASGSAVSIACTLESGSSTTLSLLSSRVLLRSGLERGVAFCTVSRGRKEYGLCGWFDKGESDCYKNVKLSSTNQYRKNVQCALHFQSVWIQRNFKNILFNLLCPLW